jgi:hypothetical protein
MMTSYFTPYCEFLNTTEETPLSPATKPSLNVLLLSALQGLQAVNPNSAMSAKQVNAYIAAHYHYTYPVQTITVVLNRFKQKAIVQRIALKVPESKQRYGFYLSQSLESLRNQELLERFKPIADEFFEGQVAAAAKYILSLAQGG